MRHKLTMGLTHRAQIHPRTPGSVTAHPSERNIFTARLELEASQTDGVTAVAVPHLQKGASSDLEHLGRARSLTIREYGQQERQR